MRLASWVGAAGARRFDRDRFPCGDGRVMSSGFVSGPDMWRALRRYGADVGRGSRSMCVCAAHFNVDERLKPTADQPAAIDGMVEALDKSRFALLKGATGTGKTLVMGHTISRVGKPTLILSHNKTLAAQLARELRGFLPNSSVELFISYYDAFQPEAYNASSDTYIAKTAVINKEIDALRHRATKALVEREDVVIVASVSCIYGLGLPKEYLEAVKHYRVGQRISMSAIVDDAHELMYEHVRSLLDLRQGCFHVKGSELTIWPPYLVAPLRVVVLQGEICSVAVADMEAIHQKTALAFPDAQAVISDEGRLSLYPARHHVTPEERREEAVRRILEELEERVAELTQEGHSGAAARLRQKTEEDVKMIREVGFCAGIENYSRHLALRSAGEAPDTLIAFFDEAFGAKQWLLIVDESHVALPQLRAMYHGDRRRKEALVSHGFRLPSAFDNRPLRDEEFWELVGTAMFVSATPNTPELELAGKEVVEMAVRPTGVADPVINVTSSSGQLEKLVQEVLDRVDREERVLVMAITKRDAEDLAEYLCSRAIKAAYLHSDLKTVQRSEVLARLQRGEIDCIVGVNLLREGIDLPEVSLVCVMDADKQGFLRSKSSLLQMVGRAARHVKGEALFFADGVSPAMRGCMAETAQRRKKQLRYLEETGIVPASARVSETASLFEQERENRVDGEVDGMGWEEVSKLLEQKRAREESRKRATEARKPAEYVPDHVEELKAQVRGAPTKSGVYLWKAGPEPDAEILYIGKAKNLRSRLGSYLRDTAITTRGTRLAAMLSRARHVETVVTPGGERDALLLESDLIKKHRPLYNVLLRDSRYYPYIVITAGSSRHLPKMMTSVRNDIEGARYFGPYTSPAHLRSVVDRIEAALELRQLRFRLKFAAEDIEKEYLEAVDMAVRVLQGDQERVAEELFQRGRAQAARLLLSLGDRSEEDEEHERAWRRVADNAKAASQLRELLGMHSVPRRIEAFDVSHFYGEHTVSSRVVFLDGEPARHLYRAHQLAHVNDDYASMRHAVEKRLRSKDPLPDLLVVDGGKGQLSAAMDAFAAEGLDLGDVQVCALAKQHEEVFVPGQMHSLAAPPDSPAVLLLRHLRDESHKHAITKMRNRRRRNPDELTAFDALEAGSA